MNQTKTKHYASKFECLSVSIEMVRALAGVVGRIRQRDGALANQVERAASSVVLNLAEGNRRRGKDRLYLFRVAAGSAEEVRVALQVAEAWGHVASADVTEPLALLDRVLAMLWRLTHPR